MAFYCLISDVSLFPLFVQLISEPSLHVSHDVVQGSTFVDCKMDLLVLDVSNYAPIVSCFKDVLASNKPT